MMKKNKLLKTLLLLTVMLVGSATNVWADPVTIFDAAAAGWSASGVSLTTGTTTVDDATYYGGDNSAIDGGKTVDGITWGKRLKFGGGSTFQKKSDDTYDLARVIAIEIPSAGTIKVYFLSGKTNDSRSVYVSKAPSTTNRDKGTAIGSASDSGSGSVAAITADEAGTYYVWSDNNIGVMGITFEATSIANVTGYSLDGVKIGGTLATENTDYTLDNNNHVVTLANSFITAPTVALVEKTTYDSGDPTTKDVAVTLSINTAGTYFEGTGTIGTGNDAVQWTVKAPVNANPTLEATVSSITVTSPKIMTGTATFTVTGANLTGENVTLAFASAVDGLSVSPETIAITDGAVNAEVTVSYVSAVDVAESSVNLTVSTTTTGVNDIVIPVTYSSTAGVTTITDVTGSTTWDWNGASSSNIESPDANSVVPLANVDGWSSSFDAASLAGKAQYFSNSGNKCFQGSVLKFHTTVAGTIVVEFSNTGSASNSRPYRYLQVNGVVTEYKSKDTQKVTTQAISVPAGDVELVGIVGTTTGNDCEPTETTNMLRIYKVVFEVPTVDETAPVFTTAPTDEATDVAIDAAVTLSADEDITAVGQTITGTIKAGDAEAAEIQFTLEGKVLTYAHDPFENNTTYTITLNANQVQDASENKNAETSFSFTTEAAQEQEVGLIVTLPTETRDGYGCTGSTTTVDYSGNVYNGQTVYLIESGKSITLTVPAYTVVSKIRVSGTSNDNNTTTVTITGVNNESASSEFANRKSATATVLDFAPTTQTTTYTIRSSTKGSWVIIKVYGEETNEATVTVSPVGYATFSSSKAFDFSESGITVYTAKANGTSVTLTEVEDGIVPANTGVVLYAAGGASATVSVATTTKTTLEDNEMVANVVLAKVYLEGDNNKTNYILSNEEGTGVGFYLAASGGAYLPANRAYLSTTTTATGTDNAPFLGFDGNETTGINSVERGALSVEGCYTLDGRRVAQPTKGLYIVNGRKVLVK